MQDLFYKFQNTRSWIIFLLLLVFLSSVFIPMSLLRIVDGDEGFYILAAKLVMHNNILYHDFFYNQTPLIPYLYGAWIKIFGNSWYAARLLSSFFAILLGLLLFYHVTYIFHNRLWGLLAVVLFTLNGLSLAWLSVVKTLGVPTCLLFASYFLLYTDIKDTYKYLLSGFLLALAIDSKLYFAIGIPAFALYFYYSEKDKKILYKHLLLGGTGIFLGLLPNLYFILQSPGNYFFGLLGYHAIRPGTAGSGLIGQGQQKLYQVLKLLCLEGVSSVQFTLLILLSLSQLISTLKFREKLPLAQYITITFFIVCLLPTPSFTQYFCTIIPFLIINSIFLVDRLSHELSSGIARERLRHLFFLSVIIYIFISPFTVYQYAVSGQGVIGVIEDAKNWKIPVINKVSKSIDENICPNNNITIAFWPGYLFASKAHLLNNMENQFGLDVAPKLNPKQLENYHIITHADITNAIANHKACIVVLGNRTPRKLWYRAQLLRSDYTMIKKIDDTEIYKYFKK
jgi:4-amino-4-deoxy-L-arabinose transferase-like glycosyltransferase